MCDSHRNGFVTVEHAQFADDVTEMEVHRPLGDVELVADIWTHHAASCEVEALPFASGERATLLDGG